MENKVLSSNLQAISRYDKELADKILRIDNIKSTFELVQNENGEYNLLYNSYPLHSTISAKEEAQKIVDNIKNIDNKNSIRIIWGLGLGYLADEFISKSSGIVIIYEPDTELLRSVFEILEFSENLSKKNVLVVNNIQKLLDWTDILSDKETKITISFLSSYLKLFGDEIKKTHALVEKTRGEKQANINTLNKIAPSATLNTLSSLNKIIKTPLLSSLKDIYKGKCALIASAGPSLEENIETIKQNRDKFILFAVGPSLKLLDKNGITPDFLCVVEAIDTRGQIEEIDTSNINLIFEPFSNTYLWDIKVKNRFLFFSKDNFLNDWLADALDININNQKSIGTVSYTALSCAKIMGFKKIILCGQNLAFKDGKCYAKGSAYEDLECVLNPQTNKYEIVAKDFEKYKQKLLGSKQIDLKYGETYVKNYIKRMNKTLYTVLGQNGESLPTQACYAIFIKYFEQFAKENPDILYINSSTGGAQINGFKNIELNEALKEEKNIEKTDILAKAPNYNTEKLNKAKEQTQALYTRILSIVSSVLKYQEEYLKEFARRKSFNKNTQNFEEKIVKILSDFTKNYYIYPSVFFLCTSYTNRFSDNLRKLKAQDNNPEINKILLSNLNILKGLDYRLKEALGYLSDK